MNKKTFVAAIAFAVAAGPVLASPTELKSDTTDIVEYSNDKYKVETNRFWSNWFISAGAGAQIYIGDHDKQASFGSRLSPALDVAVGKWFTPGIGVRLMYSGLSYKGATQDGTHSTGDYLGADKGWTYKQKFHYFNFHVDAMFNLMNLIGGYKEKRIYSLSPYFGVGVMRVTNEPKKAAISGHFGLLNSFRLCSALDLNLDLRANITSDEWDGETGGRSGEGAFAATLGLAYKINPRGWNRAKTVYRTVYNNDELDAMRDKLNKMGEENARLQKALAEKNEKEAQAVVKQIAASSLIVFPIGESELSNEARANLGMLAEVIKQGDSSAVYTITGYADKGTGSAKRNERLSKERAEAVRDCLVKEYGVDKAQLEIDYKGGVDNMFYDDPRLSRAVITRSK